MIQKILLEINVRKFFRVRSFYLKWSMNHIFLTANINFWNKWNWLKFIHDSGFTKAQKLIFLLSKNPHFNTFTQKTKWENTFEVRFQISFFKEKTLQTWIIKLNNRKKARTMNERVNSTFNLQPSIFEFWEYREKKFYSKKFYLL